MCNAAHRFIPHAAQVHKTLYLVKFMIKTPTKSHKHILAPYLWTMSLKYSASSFEKQCTFVLLCVVIALIGCPSHSYVYSYITPFYD